MCNKRTKTILWCLSTAPRLEFVLVICLPYRPALLHGRRLVCDGSTWWPLPTNNYLAKCLGGLYTRYGLDWWYNISFILYTTKDVLCYKFRRLTIGQNCSVCAQTRVAIEMHSFLEQTVWSTASFERPVQQATCHRASSKVRDEVCSLSWSGGTQQDKWIMLYSNMSCIHYTFHDNFHNTTMSISNMPVCE